MSLTDKFLELLNESECRPDAANEARELVLNAPQDSEREALMALIYHDGIGGDADVEKSFHLAELSAFMGRQSLGYYLLGLMCDKGETPDQKEGGPQQKYDHYDAERFFEICSQGSKPWSTLAHLWLGDYYINMARGGDPEVAIEHYEAIGKDNAEAAEKLSSYYLDQFEYDLNRPEDMRDPELEKRVFEWTKVACDLDPESCSYAMGTCYYDGIGCEEDLSKAYTYWLNAHKYGDWRGAAGIALIYEDKLRDLEYEEVPSSDLRKEYEAQLSKWRELSRIGQEKEAAEETDDVIEED